MLLSTDSNSLTEIDFKGVGVITIYMGDTCNFNCVYCDRDYIRDDIGSQNIKSSDHSQIISFMEQASCKAKDLVNITFHGGEPFLYLKRIDRLLDAIQPMFPDDMLFFLTTNGSLVAESEWFFKKWGKQIRLTFSYDFQYQEINREYVDVEAIAAMVQKYGSGMLFQFVCPPDREAFNEDSIANVIRTMKLAHCDTLNLIPLRHHRGAQKFKVLIDDIDLKWFSVDLMRFVQTMYVQGININIDGNYSKIDKNYLKNHGKLILSPDGYIYPEFDYLEYKRAEFRTGQWKNGAQLYRNGDEDPMILEGCRTCPMREGCGLKYLYKMFGEEPKGSCVEFYKVVNLMVKHLYKLKKQPTLMHWLGYEDD
jgi:sulfatase maturation enzyme AslB (radical SAM superfamily)